MTKPPSIILIDTETSPLTGLSWSVYKTNILKIIEPSKLLSFAWKVLGEKKTYCKAICDYDGYTPGVIDDEALVKDIWKVIDDADIIIGQNSEAFDLKKIYSRFIVHGLKAPSDFKSIDTLKEARKNFYFDSNKLNDLATILGVKAKLQTGGLSLWLDCIAGNSEAWKKMKLYNAGDVDSLEEVYLKIRPYILNHPNLGLIAESPEVSCSACMSTDLQKRGYSFTVAGKKRRFQCNSCGAWSTGPYQRRSVVAKLEEESNDDE